GLIRVKGK
ncbi:hypothetical protein FOXB_15677, partial [Fusarium oxysporum f. sp. conglutinans Fo5176]